MSQRIALVTGASSGIGRALTELLCREGWSVILLVRDRQRLTAPPDCDVWEADLADREATGRALAGIARKYDRIDAVFANAGVLMPSLVYSPQGRELHFEVHVVAVHQLLDRLAGPLAAGRAVVVASGSSIRRMVRAVTVDELVKPRRFVPLTGPYASSKFALAAYFAESSSAWADRGVRLCYVDLPPTKTGMAEGLPGWMKVFRFAFASPEDAARRLWAAAERPRNTAAVPVPGLAAWLDLRSGA